MFAKLFSKKSNTKVIFAQGNYDKKYTNTRHNIGFEILDKFAEANQGSWKNQAKFQALICEISLNGQKIVLAKPTTFYNETGRSIQSIMGFYKLDVADDLLLIHDDLALPFGSIRTRQKGSDGGNNGIKSVNSTIGDSYKRIRIGIYSDLRDRMDDADFVLSKFSAVERKSINDQIIPKTIEIIQDFIDDKFETTSINLSKK